MASQLNVDNINNSAGTALLVNGYPRQPGQIIEILTSPCDGSSVTVGSGTYTFQNVTTQQGYVGTTYTDISGSTMAYQPPAGATRVRYEFQFSSYWVGAHAINGYIFFVDGNEVTLARHNRSGQYMENKYTFTWTIAIGGANTPSTGRVATWTSPKTLKMQYNQYGASNYANLHGTVYWNGTNSNQFNIPTLTITAIA
jgi:hypothetical protein